jgi:hypothetical protein
MFGVFVSVGVAVTGAVCVQAATNSREDINIGRSLFGIIEIFL